MTGGQQLMKRIPRIKFPQRHPKPSESRIADSVSQQPQLQGIPAANPPDVEQGFFLKSMVSASPGGKASLQPKRMPVSKEEMEAIMMGGCF